jgi:hypothetical protein
VLFTASMNATFRRKGMGLAKASARVWTCRPAIAAIASESLSVLLSRKLFVNCQPANRTQSPAFMALRSRSRLVV